MAEVFVATSVKEADLKDKIQEQKDAGRRILALCAVKSGKVVTYTVVTQ